MLNWMIKSWRTLATTVGMILILSTAVGGIVAADTRYAKASYVSEVEERLDVKIIQDKMASITERMWKIEDRWTDQFKEEFSRLPNSIDELKSYMNEDARDRYRELEEELIELEKQLTALRNKEKK